MSLPQSRIVAVIVAATIPLLGTTIAGCGSSALEGRVFLASVQSPTGVVDAISVDFIATQSDLSQGTVMLTVTSSVPLVFDAVQGSPDCLRVPASGHTDLVPTSGQVGLDARVSVTAHRDNCTGDTLDTAVWPASTATPMGDGGDSAADGAGPADSSGSDVSPGPDATDASSG